MARGGGGGRGRGIMAVFYFYFMHDFLIRSREMEGGVGRGGWLEAAMHAWLCMTQSFRPIQEVYGFVKDTLLSKLDKVRNSVHQSPVKTCYQGLKEH